MEVFYRWKCFSFIWLTQRDDVKTRCCWTCCSFKATTQQNQTSFRGLKGRISKMVPWIYPPWCNEWHDVDSFVQLPGFLVHWMLVVNKLLWCLSNGELEPLEAVVQWAEVWFYSALSCTKIRALLSVPVKIRVIQPLLVYRCSRLARGKNEGEYFVLWINLGSL